MHAEEGLDRYSIYYQYIAIHILLAFMYVVVEPPSGQGFTPQYL